MTERDEQLRAFHAAGWRPVDLQRVTGYSRETIRQALRPEVRLATNISRRRTSPQPPADYRPYGDRKPYVVAETLAALHGPTDGTVTLPRHLDWSGHGEYDLNRRQAIAARPRCDRPTQAENERPPEALSYAHTPAQD
nr:hypothetical protein [Micromonospora sp. KC207]